MRFLIVSSPHGATTRDVWKRVCKGFELNGFRRIVTETEQNSGRHIQGDAFLPWDLLPRWRIFDWMLDRAKARKYELPGAFKSNLLAYEPVLGSAIYHDCEYVIIISPQYCPTPLIDLLRQAGKKTIGVFTECPYEDTLIAPIQAAHFDYVAVSDRNSVGLFQSFCPNVLYVPHSFDPDIHYANGTEREDKIVYVGTLYPGRKALLRSVDWETIPLDLYGMHWTRKSEKLHRYVRGDIQENEDVAELYRRSAASFNMHRRQRYGFMADEIDPGEAYSAGPRVYELAACGTFQCSDYREEIADIFEDSVPFYETAQGLEAILRRAIDDPVWREEMAGKQRDAVQGRDCGATMKRLLEAVA